MALMLSKTHDTLIAADAPEDKAREAAEAIAIYENRFSGIEIDLSAVRADREGGSWCG